MTELLATLQLGLGVILVAAAGGKLVRPAELAAALRLSHIPTAAARLLVPVIICLELIIGTGLMLAKGALLVTTFAAAAVLVGGFTGWVSWVRFRGLVIRCSCFGAGNKNVTGKTVARNALLLAAAIAGIVVAAGESTPLPALSSYWVLTVAAILAVVLLGAALNQARGQLILSLDTLQHRRNTRAQVRT
jgi:hypothetical protein